MNSSQAIHEQPQAKDMPDMPRGIFCEGNSQYSILHTLKEAPFCTDQWEQPPHSLDRRIATDLNILCEKDDLDPHADEQLEEYVNELVPALHMVHKNTNNMDIAHRKEAIMLTAAALLVKRTTGNMAWSDALSKRVSNYCNKAHGHQGTESLDLAREHPDYIASTMECASISSCIRTPVSSEGTDSGEFSDHDFSAFHHGSTASHASSDHSSIVGSTSATSELLQDDMDALNYVQSGVSLPLMDIVSSSDAHMSSVNSSGELLSMWKQGERQLKSEDQLHEEINARLAMIRSCCNEDAGIAKRSSNSALESLQVASSTREQHACTINDTPANVKDYHLMRKQGLHDHGISHAGEGFHVVNHDVACGCADLAHSELTCYVSASVSQLPCADLHNGNAHHEVGCGDGDVAWNVVHTLHDVSSERAGVAPCNSAEMALGKPKRYKVAVGNADAEGGDMKGLQGSAKEVIDGVADEVDANQGGQVDAEMEGGLRWQQGLTWQGSMYVATADDVAGDVLYGPEEDLDRGCNNKMRERMYRAAAYQPIDWESIMEDVVGKERSRRRNVRISKEPQSVAARQRRERISDRILILQRLVPGASKLDTASMLDEAIHYLKFLKLQVQALRRIDKILNRLPLPLIAPSI